MTVIYDAFAELFVFCLAAAYCVLFVILVVYWFRTRRRLLRELSRRSSPPAERPAP